MEPNSSITKAYFAVVCSLRLLVFLRASTALRVTSRTRSIERSSVILQPSSLTRRLLVQRPRHRAAASPKCRMVSMTTLTITSCHANRRFLCICSPASRYHITVSSYSAGTAEAIVSGGWFGVHINEVKLRRARLVLGLVTTFGGSTIPVFIRPTQTHSAWPSLCG